MQMNKSQSVDLKEFGFTPKPSLSSISRYKYNVNIQGRIVLINSLFLQIIMCSEKGEHWLHSNHSNHVVL